MREALLVGSSRLLGLRRARGAGLHSPQDTREGGVYGRRTDRRRRTGRAPLASQPGGGPFGPAQTVGVREQPHHRWPRAAHKRDLCSRIARLQIEAGAVGICCATLREARAMVRAGIALEAAIEPALSASPLMQRQLDLARGLAAEPAGIVLRGYFKRLTTGTAETFMGVLREVANRGVACYIVAGSAREAELTARAVRLVFGPSGSLGLGRSLRLGFT